MISQYIQVNSLVKQKNLSQAHQYLNVVQLIIKMKIDKKYFLILLILTIAYSQQLQKSANINELSVNIRSRKSSDSKYSSLVGFIIGPILFVLSFVGIWFNEKRAAVNYKRLKLCDKLLQKQLSCQQINLDSYSREIQLINSEKRLVHKTGVSQILDPAKDEKCSVYLSDAIVVKRTVEVKEMRSHAKRRSDEDQIQYKLEWVSSNIEQCQAQSNSPLRWFIKNQTFYAPWVRVSGYFLNQSQMQMLQCENEVNPSNETIQAINKIAQSTGNYSQPKVFQNYIYYPGTEGDVQSRGSLRVKFSYCKQTKLSIICTVNQSSNTYQPFQIDIIDNEGPRDELPCGEDNCCICCSKLAEALKPMSEVNLILKGEYKSSEMISIFISKNSQQTNLLRIVFFILMVLGILIFFSPFAEILGYIPIVGGFLKGTAFLIISLGALLVSIPLFFVTFGIAWLRYHPAIGGSILLASVIILIALSSIK